MPIKYSKRNKNPSNDRVALEFAAGDMEQVLKKVVQEQCPFELIEQNIIILSRDAANKLEKQFLFRCKELKIVPLSSLPRDEANQIRKRHFRI